jgi:hypothetical protein
MVGLSIGFSRLITKSAGYGVGYSLVKTLE